MKLHTEDPRLTAYVLGELGPDDAAAVESAVAEDPALQAEVDDLRATQGLLAKRLLLSPERLMPSQRENVRRSTKASANAGGKLTFAKLREKLQPLLIPTAAATVLMGATLILVRMPQPPEKPVAAKPKPVVPPKPSNLPAAGPVNPASQQAAARPATDTTDLPPLVRRAPLKATEFPTLDLPVQAGRASMEWVSKAILESGQLPRHDAVRPEEILNHFQFRFSGTTAISRARDLAEWHPDREQDAAATAPVATLSTEMLACPWKPSSILLFVSLRGGPAKSSEVRLSYQSNPGNVFRYRLIGFASVAGAKGEKLPTTLAADSSTVLAIEIEPSKPGGELGSLVWSTDGKPAPAITLVHKGDAEPSNDARFAALVCTYTQWLAGEQAGAIDADIVSALAREIASSEMAPERSEFLSLIDRSLHL